MFSGPLAGASRVLFLHAHPDDETIATGALIAALTSAGVTVGMLTATRGEQGEIVPGSLPELGAAELSAARAAELTGALRELGVAVHAYLGTPPARAAGLPPRRYRDSGMRWVRPGLAGPGSVDDPEALSVADLGEVVADIRAMIEGFAPDLLVTYDEMGGYGHPDHVLLHRAGLAAGRAAGIKVAEIIESDAGPASAADITWVDAADHRDVVIRALRQHASQLTVDGDDIVHVGGQREPITTRTGLRLLA